MTDTTISGAVAFPQDRGTGVTDGKSDFPSAGYLGTLGQAIDTDYVAKGLDFTNVDATNNTVDVTSGVAFLSVSGADVQDVDGGYNVTLPNDMATAVALPNSVTLSLDSGAVNDIWLAVNPGSQEGVYIRHGSGLSSPTDPSIKLGTVDTSNGSTTRGNLGANINVDGITTGKVNVDGDITLQSDYDTIRSTGASLDLSDGTYYTADNNRFRVRDSTNSQDILTAKEGGNVEIPNGDLDVGTNGVTRLTHLTAEYNTPAELKTGGGGGSRWDIKDVANNQIIASFNEGGNVEIPNGNLSVDTLAGSNMDALMYGSWADFRLQGASRFNYIDNSGNSIIGLVDGGNVKIPNGNLTLDTGQLKFGGTNAYPRLVRDNDHLRLYTNTAGQVLALLNGGGVEIPNGHVDVAGGVEGQQRGAPSTTELASGASMVYTSDGTDAGAAGDLMYAVNDAGTIKTSVVAAKANAT